MSDDFFSDLKFIPHYGPFKYHRRPPTQLRKKVTDYLTHRIERDEYLLGVAFLAAMRSTCARLQVGAVIADEGRIISTGYAGAPARMPHCSSDVCDLTQPCTRTIHAETNAIAWAARSAIAVEGCSLYCTHSPCLECAKLIINAGIIRVIYGTPYRKTDGPDLLKSVGVECEHLPAKPELRTVSGLGIGRNDLFVGQRTYKKATFNGGGGGSE